MNKSQLVDALADRLGDRRAAATAVDALLQTIVETVRSGDSVSIAGFGVFESRARAARTGRNPRTGEAVDVPATTVPAFRPGTGFRTAVAGEGAPAAITPGAPRRRPVTAGKATNGAPAASSVALDGAVELTATDAAAVADTPAPDKGKKKKATKDAPKAAAKESGKDTKKGKKGKK